MEVCYNGNYHPVCDEGWSDNDAVVACNTVGYSSDFYRKSNPKHKYHTIPLYHFPLQVLELLGSKSLVCQMNLPYSKGHCVTDMSSTSVTVLDINSTMSQETTVSVGNTKQEFTVQEVDASHPYDRLLISNLLSDLYPTSTTACSDGETRLENSTYSFNNGVFMYGGRVEVCYRGIFHPVCDEKWTDSDAAVVCNSIGYTTAYHSKLEVYCLLRNLIMLSYYYIIIV